MKLPRFTIARLMFVVLLVALDFGLGKALTDPPLLRMPLTELLIIGAFPMGNILAVGIAFLVAGRREPVPRRPALVGFVAFGLTAWLVFVTCSAFDPIATNRWFRGPIMASRLTPGLPLASFAALVMTLPQLAFAALGWWLGRSFVIRWNFAVERRAVG